MSLNLNNKSAVFLKQSGEERGKFSALRLRDHVDHRLHSLVGSLTELLDKFYIYRLASGYPADEEWLNPLREKFSLPEVDTSDVGKFLRVSADGKWAAELLQDVSEVGM